MAESTKFGRYILKEKLATGGMAEIWLAEQAGPAGFQKELVIKRILPHLADDETFVEMFLDEARLAAKLNHPNIVQIFDLGSLDGSYFIAMEYIDGVDLEAIVSRSRDLGMLVPPEIAAKICSDALVGLDFAHNFTDRDGTALELVHRDISPQNILISHGGVVKVVDFGVAKAATSTHKTQTGAVKGKLAYMSPEQIGGEKLDGRSDIFAMGIVLFELLTQVRPFGNESEYLAVSAILHEPHPALRKYRPELPSSLEEVVDKALSKEVDERYDSASQMQRALQSYLQRRGALLTTPDIAAYLADLFSDNPTGTIPALEGLSREQPARVVDIASTQEAPRTNSSGGSETIVEPPPGGSASTRLESPAHGSEQGQVPGTQWMAGPGPPRTEQLAGDLPPQASAGAARARSPGRQETVVEDVTSAAPQGITDDPLDQRAGMPLVAKIAIAMVFLIGSILLGLYAASFILYPDYGKEPPAETATESGAEPGEE